MSKEFGARSKGNRRNNNNRQQRRAGRRSTIIITGLTRTTLSTDENQDGLDENFLMNPSP